MFKFILFIAPCVLVSCSYHGRAAEEVQVHDPALLDDLRLIQKHRIYFGHQSVGANVLAGLKDLAGASSATPITLVSFAGGPLPAGGVFAESTIGENGRPEAKFDAFSRNIKQLVSSGLNVALMKLCYVDFNRDTDVGKLFAQYRNTIDHLQVVHPGIVFIHVTAPLTTRPAPWKAIAKSALGRDDASDADNLKRCEFNTLLTRHYAGTVIFDLARVESTLPNGRRSTFEYRGATGYSLFRDYAADNGHLNELGRRVGARELIRTLAGALRSKPAPRAAATGAR